MFHEDVLQPYLNDGFVKSDMDRMNMVSLTYTDLEERTHCQ